MTYQETIVPIMKGKNKGNKQYLKRLSIQAIFRYLYTKRDLKGGENSMKIQVKEEEDQ